MKKDKIKAAVIQMVSKACVDENLEQAGLLIAQAAQQQCQLVVLPENFAVFGHPALAQVAESETNPGPILNFLSGCAKLHKVWIVAGTAPFSDGTDGRAGQAGKIFPGSSVWNPNGQCVTRYDKRHLFDVEVADGVGRYCESDTFMAGTLVKMAETPWGGLGLSVCYDLRFPEHFRALSKMGATMLAVPSAFTYQTGEAHWEVLLRARAIENQCYVLAPNQGGHHGSNRVTWGHSCIVDPWGEVIALCRDSGNAVITADLDFVQQQQLRKKMPVLAHRLDPV